MSVEPASASRIDAGTLRGCLVDGDLQQRTLERRVRRRALVLSIVLQSAAIAALLIFPLFGKSPQIVAREYIPIPPYRFHAGDNRSNLHRQPRLRRTACFYCPTVSLHPIVQPLPPDADDRPTSPDGSVNIGPVGPTTPGQIDMFDRRQPPSPVQPPRAHHHLVHTGTIDPAMLTHRVEPIYPPLMRQIHRDGRVELRAIISADGDIESLQVVSGDPGFYQSALDAVRQWRYKPTYLNGEPVEVETNITVIYKIN
ncbi:MAG TPA: TonB family protein [Candidatus Acidoferrum sp.]|nr:TonB family protein [Candidatus Acidoferrum sp.]